MLKTCGENTYFWTSGNMNSRLGIEVCCHSFEKCILTNFSMCLWFIQSTQNILPRIRKLSSCFGGKQQTLPSKSAYQ